MKSFKSFTIVIGMSTLMVLACSKDKSFDTLTGGPVHGEGITAGTTNYAVRVSIQNSGFSPAEFMVVVSGTVLWVNNDNTVHTVTADNGSFDSGDLQPGASFAHKFTINGPHYYRCKYHPETTGLAKAVTK